MNMKGGIFPPIAWWLRGPRLYFLHIPKTAGLSVTQWLSDRLGAEGKCPAMVWDQLVALDRRDIRRCKWFAGHFGVELESFLRHQLSTVTVLRDPVARTVSHYAHVARRPLHPHHLRVSRGSQSLDAFVKDRDNWSMIENFQARYLARGAVSFKGYAGRYDSTAAKVNRLAVLSEDARYLLDPVYVRESAIEALQHRVRVVGTTEQLRDFLCRVAEAFRLRPLAEVEAIPIENAAPVPAASELAPATLEIIHHLTAIDRELYDWVKLQSGPSHNTPRLQVKDPALAAR
jgi:hypothetical protein